MSFSRAGGNKSVSQPPSNNSNNNIPRPPPPAAGRRASNNNSTTNQSSENTPRGGNAATSSSASTPSSRLFQPTASSSLRASSNRGGAGSRRHISSSSNNNSDNDHDDEHNTLWIAVNKPSALYSAPNGHQVGEAEVGTVVEEYGKTVDMFGAEWIASIAVDERVEKEIAASGTNSPNKNSFSSSSSSARNAPVAGRRRNNNNAAADSSSLNSSMNNTPVTTAEPQQSEVSYIWFRRYEKGDSLQSKRDVLWEVKTSTTTANSIDGGASADGQSQKQAAPPVCNPSNAPLRALTASSSSSISAASSSSDYSLILQYMEQSNNKAPTQVGGGPRDWNTEYQLLVEKLCFNNQRQQQSEANNTDKNQEEDDLEKITEDTRIAIHKLYSEFAEEIGKIGIKIVNELNMSVSERSVKPFFNNATGGIVLGTYFHNGIMYRVNVDSDGSFNGDKNAMKIANQILKANNFVGTAGPLFFLHQPLLMVMNFRGFRISASTIPPLRKDGLLAGSMDHGKTWKQPVGFFQTIVDEFGEQLGLAKHQVKQLADLEKGSSANAEKFTTPLPFDCCIVGGFDQRFYTMNVGRFLPPLIPLKNHPGYLQSPVTTTSLFWRLRPELVNRLDFKLSCDSFVPHASHVEDNEDAVAASTLLRDHAIPSVAAVLGFLEPTLAPTMTLDECVSCKKRNIQSHLTFSICEDECCVICPQCYLEIQKTAFWDNKIEEAEEKVQSLIGACKSMPRTLKGFVMTPDISTIMHAHGVNLRYMNIVYQKIPRSAFHCTGHYVEIEMIARTAQNMLSEILRKCGDNDEANQKTAQFFVALLQPSGEKAERFWAEELGPQVMKQYDVTSPFDTEHLDRDLVYRRVSELTGVQFSAASVKSLLTEKPFVQMLPPQPVLKQTLLPNLVEKCGERREYLDRYSGLIGVYWSELPYKSIADEEMWKNKIPLHFRED